MLLVFGSLLFALVRRLLRGLILSLPLLLLPAAVALDADATAGAVAPPFTVASASAAAPPTEELALPEETLRLS